MPTLHTTNEEVAHHRCHLLIYYTDFRKTTLDVLKTKRRPFSTNSELILIKSEIVFMPSDVRQFKMLSASSIAHLLVVFTIPNYILYSIKKINVNLHVEKNALN